MPPVRLELTAFRLWDWRAAYCATEARWCKHLSQPEQWATGCAVQKKVLCTHGGTRTPNLRFRRPTPYPLGHAGTVEQTGLQPEHMDDKSNLTVKSSASPGNRTRVARMGILHDTTTPATHSLGQLPNKVCLANPVFWSDCRQIFGLNQCMLGFWWVRKYTARLAQSVEHETLNLRVVGSSPTLGDLFSHIMFY